MFNANAAQLGQLRDNDLVEHIVEAYSSVQALAEQANPYKGVSNTDIALRDINALHLTATTTHVQVIKLHNRLTGVPADGEINIDDTEVESRKHLAEYRRLLDAGRIDVILSKRWHDA